MSSTGLQVFDRTLQITNIWLGELCATLGPNRRAAWHALRAVLHVLRDRLPTGLAVHLGAELPLLVRGLYYENWRPGISSRSRSLDDFLGGISKGLADGAPVGALDATRAVFALLDRRLDEGQVRKVRQALPEAVSALWPQEPVLGTFAGSASLREGSTPASRRSRDGSTELRSGFA